MQAKPWYTSTTIWIGICTSLSGIIPLGAVLIQVIRPDWLLITAAVAAFCLGVIQVLRRTWLDPQTPPAAIK